MSFALISSKPGRVSTMVLSWTLFAAGIAAYFYVSAARHRDNPEDRVMPTIGQMARGMFDAALRPAEDEEQQTADNASLGRRFLGSMLWKDTAATARRFFFSMVLLIPAVI